MVRRCPPVRPQGWNGCSLDEFSSQLQEQDKLATKSFGLRAGILFLRRSQLGPRGPTKCAQAGTGFALLLAGRFDEAASWAEKAAGDLPNYLSAVQRHGGGQRRLDGQLRQVDPQLRLSNLQNLYPIRRSRWSDGVERAGLPE
jgi:hypothetical protein